MRWWLQTDSPQIMSVDNSSVSGMDFSSLLVTNPDLWMVQWTDGKGEIERQQVATDTNLNGLREAFIDVTPYASMFQQFLSRMKAKNLLLDQAKKIQIELINELFNSKRQLPYHYPVAAGDYWWNASDASMYSATIPATQNNTSKLNEVITALNALTPSINSQVIDRSNTSFGQITSGVNTAVIDTVNANVNKANNSISVFNANADAANVGLLRTVIGSVPVTGSDPINISGAPGNTSNALAHSVYTESGVPSYISATGIPSYISWSPIAPVSTTNVQWIPIGGTTPVNVTPAEQAAILNGIAARANQLSLVRNTKVGEVNALTTVDGVIAYDVLAGWPVIPLPPGYNPALAPTSESTNLAIIGTPTAPSGGVPEAPSDGVTYGRRNAIWNPALALSGDVLDGGNF